MMRFRQTKYIPFDCDFVVIIKKRRRKREKRTWSTTTRKKRLITTITTTRRDLKREKCQEAKDSFSPLSAPLSTH